MDMALAATGAIRGSSREKLYQKLGLEALYHRRWFHNLWFTKLIKPNVLVIAPKLQILTNEALF